MKRTISVNLGDVTGKTWVINDLKELYRFAKVEFEYWEKSAQECSPPNNQLHTYFNGRNYFKNLITSIDNWKENLENWDDTQLTQHINNLQRGIFNPIRQHWLWSGHAFTGTFVEIQKSYGQHSATSFANFLINKQVNANGNKESFIGTLLAYEFELQNSDLTKRRNSEKVSLRHLRNTLEKTTNSLTGEVEQFKDNFALWNENTQTSWTDWKAQIEEEYNSVKSEQKHKSTEQLTNQKNEFISYIDGCRTRISDLENTYQEKLRLEKPAEYWKKSARKYGVQGSLWSLALISSILLGLVYFFDFFNSWLEGQETSIKLNTLQGAVIFGSILAVYAFLVKTLSKLTFSSFHLMRDSEEREQLTYLYLSLNNEGQIDGTSRELVLQALFSRTETGLLSGDSGPTMPVQDLLKEALKTK
ncbi:DUF6161 domain-containing protein [Microbulbifer hainanensis]|uniref:DUF6161 domain-containing protein n=1 Tax=Microbulbifer hainanensis TaxID=2735675 RepID=UPI001866853E|nr:DUF6161 domain-containing protein [Microbulbifer hainanensis]